ncbi:MAG: pyridoxamine 5'-phosphate oxidase family protein [Actinomycetota bacterium]|nr:pyridoxamine 5'-phosphate oxidase family protein [Actinomycetota bacterium]
MSDELNSSSHLNDEMRELINSSMVFFVATAPLSADGKINLSPKGLSDTFSILDDHRVAYLDLTGSGAETAAHLKENGRVTLMWMSHDPEAPNILRIYGNGVIHEVGTIEFELLKGRFGEHVGARGVVVVTISHTNLSCGFGVPVANSFTERPELDEWLDKKGEEGLSRYRDRNNRESLDGLPGYSI